MRKEAIIKNTAIILLAILLAIAAFVLIKGWIGGHFNSMNTLRSYVASYGLWAPMILLLIQVLLTILPVCPSFSGCVVGAALFGAAGGFWINYIGISAGSVIAYFLARNFGIRLVRKMLPLHKYDAYIEKIRNSKNYPKVLFFAILLPLAPDNLLCYLSGIINLPAKAFIMIIVTAKPWCILVYSIFFAYFL